MGAMSADRRGHGDQRIIENLPELENRRKLKRQRAALAVAILRSHRSRAPRRFAGSGPGQGEAWQE